MSGRRRFAAVVASAALVWLLPVAASAGQAAPSLRDVLKETQQQSDKPGRITVAWWFPAEFWAVALQQNGGVPAGQTEALLSALRPFLLFAAADGGVSPTGEATFADEPALRAAVTVIDRNGRSYTPVPEGDLPPDLRTLNGEMKTMFGKMMGPVGQGLQFFLFPAATPDGSEIAVATKAGAFALAVAGETFRWRLPLGSLLPAKVCPVDGERLSGAWSFCPWHGRALEPAPAPPAVAR